MKRIITVFILFLPLSYLISCGCGEITFEECSEWADEIFIGKITSIDEDYTPFFNYLNGKKTNFWSTTFKVHEKWKGNNSNHLTIVQSYTSCDVPFENIGRNYLIYAKRVDIMSYDSTRAHNYLSTLMCTRTTPTNRINNEDNDITNLDAKYQKIFIINMELFIASLIGLIFIIISRRVLNR